MKILIIEDEGVAVQRLTKMIQSIENNADILADLDTIDAAIAWFQANVMPDLVFLDIYLADGSSFEIFKKTNITCPIVFTTAYDEYALQAFKVNAIDYLLKPIKKVELIQSFEKFKRLHPSNVIDYQEIIKNIQTKNADTYQTRFLIRYGQKYKIIEVKDIAYFFIQEKIVFACTFEGKHYPMDYNLDKLEPMLSPTEFFRINRQVMARHSAIQELYAYSKSRVKVHFLPRLDCDVVVSKERTSLFKEWLEG